MKIKLYILAAVILLVLCFSSFNKSYASYRLDPDDGHGHRVERVLTDGVWQLIIYDKDGGIIRVVTIGSN